MIPKRYTYVDDKESYEVIFEGKRAKIISDSSETISLESRNLIYDPISMLVLLMQNSNYADQAYSVISKKKLKIYDYKFRNHVIYSINGKDFIVIPQSILQEIKLITTSSLKIIIIC